MEGSGCAARPKAAAPRAAFHTDSPRGWEPGLLREREFGVEGSSSAGHGHPCHGEQLSPLLLRPQRRGWTMTDPGPLTPVSLASAIISGFSPLWSPKWLLEGESR